MFIRSVLIMVSLIIISCSVETNQEQKKLTKDSVETLSIEELIIEELIIEELIIEALNIEPKIHVLTGDTDVYINKIVSYDSKHFIVVNFDRNEDNIIFELTDNVKIKLKTIPEEDGINSEIIRDAGIINLNHNLNHSKRWFLAVEKGVVYSIDEIW